MSNGTLEPYDPSEGSNLKILIGGFGSGKTEIAVNLCESLSKTTSAVTLVDIDLVKPLFRSREARDTLKGMGVRSISTAPGLESADMPALSPEIGGALQGIGDGRFTIVDVGGDDTGATALGRYNAEIMAAGYELLVVVNPFRPFTGTVEGVMELLEAMERRSRLKASALVSNPNLGVYTDTEDVRRGHGIVRRISEVSGLGIRFLGVWEGLFKRDAETLREIAQGLPVFPLRQYMLPPWRQEGFEMEEV